MRFAASRANAATPCRRGWHKLGNRLSATSDQDLLTALHSHEKSRKLVLGLKGSDFFDMSMT
jgi:hypothetical protein